MPRSSWARIVPEFPWAPISAPCAIARVASASVGLPGSTTSPEPTAWAANTASTAATADSTVRYRLVPVSPSATG